MKSRSLAAFCFFLISFGYFNGFCSGDIKYRVADIPKQLLKDAKAVVRCEEIVTEVKANDKLVQKVKYAITILNKNGDSNSRFRHSYDKNTKVSGLKAQLYNESGLEFRKKGGFDILDYALISEGSAYNDQRIKAMDPEQYEYPYTVEYTYEISFSGVLNYPDWYPVDDYNLSVEKSTFTLIVAKDAVCRYSEKNMTSKVQVQNTAENTTYSWELINIPAFRDENFGPALSDFTPAVLIAPSQINVDGYKGNIETWTGFGQWINKLNQDRDNLTDESKARIRKMVEGITDERAKIKVLYEYMQNKTRYVSITIGIGGFQPFDAETVDRLSYGDCKALSNYMKSILEVVGISSRYTLVEAGHENPAIQSDFPSSQFNHAILCVPLASDTIWLECTSQTNPFNYMGTFTASRPVLVVDEQGGKMVNTPALQIEDNLESRKTTVTLDADGGGLASVSTTFHGATYDAFAPILMSDQADRKKMVSHRIHVPNFELDNFSIQETKVEKPYVTENLKLSLSDYCTRVGGKLMLCLNMMNQLSESPFQATSRKNAISFKWPINEVDTVSYEIPQGYTLEKIPAKVSIQSDYGQYTTEVSRTGSTLQYIRRFKVYKAEHPVEKYDDIVIFFEKVVTADENKVMLTKML